jgi:ATP-dependent Zn protease
VVIGATNH